MAEATRLGEAAMDRRAVLRAGALVVVGGAVSGCRAQAAAAAQDGPVVPEPVARLGLLTDVHYADKATAGTRHYRDSLGKMRAAVDGLREVGVDAVVELGDLIDSAADVEGEVAHLRAIDAEYARVGVPRHYVLGNHCVHTLMKEEFIEHSGMTATHTSFDLGGVRFVTLDACFTGAGEPYQRGNFDWTDANVPGGQLAWLEAQLAGAPGAAVVLTHQRVDGLEAPHNVKNHAAVRGVMEAAGNVALVLSGHSHANLHDRIAGIDYVVVRAMVEGGGLENNGFGRLLAYADGSLAVEGYAQQAAVAVGLAGA